MAIFHIAYHGYRQKPSQEQFEEFAGMLSAYFAAAPYIEDGAAGRYAGPAEDGFHDAAWVKFNSVDDYAVHMRSPHGEDEATHLKETVARVRSFDIITPLGLPVVPEVYIRMATSSGRRSTAGGTATTSDVSAARDSQPSIASLI